MTVLPLLDPNTSFFFVIKRYLKTYLLLGIFYYSNKKCISFIIIFLIIINSYIINLIQ